MSEQQNTVRDNANPLAKQFTVPALLRFAAPTICMMVFSGLYTTVDTVFVARFVNTDALSSINIVTPVIQLIVGLGTMLAAGGSAVVARKMGAGQVQEAKQTFTLLGTLFLTPLLDFLGASARLFPYGREYLFTLLLFAPASVLQVLFNSLFVAAGKPGLGMMLGFGAGLTNAVLDFVFMGPMHMGIRGAAIATGLGYCIPALAGVLFFWRRRGGTLHFVRPKMDWRGLGESCFNGSSEMIGQLSAAVTTFLFNATMLRLLGEDGVAAIAILIYTQFLLTTLHIGFSMGVAPLLSYRHGAGETREIGRLLRMSAMFIGVASALIFAVTVLGSRWLVVLFSPPGTPVYFIATGGFAIFRISFLFCGVNIFTSALFTALSNGKVSALISLFRTFGFIAAALLVLPQFWGVTGVWLAVPLAEGLSLLLSLYALWRYRECYGLK